MYYSALIGKPTEHSVSDVLFPLLASVVGLDDGYAHIKIDTEKDNLAQNLKSFSNLGFSGINVTLPYKLDIAPLMSELDESASLVGAVNTVKFANNKTIGYNTDWYGIYYPIYSKFVGSDTDNLGPQLVVIFGNGGASRAAIFAARKLKAHKTVVCYRSSIDHNEQIKDLYDRMDEYSIELVSYDDVVKYVVDADIIINTTSTGMRGNPAGAPFNLSILDSENLTGKIFMDAVFNPADTEMFRYFAQKGVKTIDGLWMMIYQAVLALGLWVDIEVNVTDTALLSIHDILLKEVSRVQTRN